VPCRAAAGARPPLPRPRLSLKQARPTRPLGGLLPTGSRVVPGRAQATGPGELTKTRRREEYPSSTSGGKRIGKGDRRDDQAESPRRSEKAAGPSTLPSRRVSASREVRAGAMSPGPSRRAGQGGGASALFHRLFHTILSSQAPLHFPRSVVASKPQLLQGRREERCRGRGSDCSGQGREWAHSPGIFSKTSCPGIGARGASPPTTGQKTKTTKQVTSKKPGTPSRGEPTGHRGDGVGGEIYAVGGVRGGGGAPGTRGRAGGGDDLGETLGRFGDRGREADANGTNRDQHRAPPGGNRRPARRESFQYCAANPALFISCSSLFPLPFGTATAMVLPIFSAVSASPARSRSSACWSPWSEVPASPRPWRR
jgi:hypothetical protein